MPKFFVNEKQIEDDKFFIVGEDVNHIKNVLRMKVGDTFFACDDENSKNYLAEISNFEKDRINCKIIERMKDTAESNIKVHIFQGLPKSDKMELIIQKSVELGAFKITPTEMKRCVVKLDVKDKAKKVYRWQKIAEVAAKQSGRDIIPEVCSVKSLKDVLEELKKFDLVLLCYENEKEIFLKDILNEAKRQIDYNKDYNVAVIIGPEGGIDVSEVEMLEDSKTRVISLGNRILRTETVALSVLSIIMYEFERNDI